MFRLLAVLAALASIPTSALAAPEPNPPIPSVYAMPTQPRATVAATTLDGTPTAYAAPAVLEVPAADQATLRAGGSPVVYFVQQPVAAPVEPKATVSAGDTGGLLGKVGGIVGIFGFLGMGLLVLFKLWTGERSTAVRMAVINAAEAAWYSGEAVGGPTGDKIKASSEAFLKGMEALGIKRPDAQQLALRDAAFESMSKADKVTKARLAALVAPAKETTSDPQTPLAES